MFAMGLINLSKSSPPPHPVEMPLLDSYFHFLVYLVVYYLFFSHWSVNSTREFLS